MFEKRYDDQIFQMPAEHELAPTFEDRIRVPLAPGAYVIELVAFELYPGDTSAALDKVENANSRRGPAGRVKLRLTD